MKRGDRKDGWQFNGWKNLSGAQQFQAGKRRLQLERILKRGGAPYIAVQVPANPDVTKLKRSGDAATHMMATYSVGLLEGHAGCQSSLCNVYLGFFFGVKCLGGDPNRLICLAQVAIKKQSS